MAEYIEREAALKAIAEDKIEMTPELIAIGRAIGTYTAEQAFDGINQACDRHIESIKIIPAADVQPIVRCKDCVYKPRYEPPDSKDVWDLTFPFEWESPCPCYCEDGYYSHMPNDEWFCAYGKRMDGET